MAWRLLKTLLFTVIVPGTVAGWVPQWLLEEQHRQIYWPLHWSQWIGFPPFLIGALIYLRCAWDFAVTGLGTPAPIDAPKVLIVKGLYRYVRNPMYVGVLNVILGQAIFYGSRLVFIYMAGAWLFFHMFVAFYEEPELHRLFGAQYEDYCRTVSRWIPKLPKAAASVQ